MKRIFFVLTILLALHPIESYAFGPNWSLITGGRQGETSPPVTAYYLGFPSEIETTSPPSASPSSTYGASTDTTLFIRVTVPAGATIRAAHYYFGGTIAVANIKFGVWLDGTYAKLAEASITPAANQWVRSSIFSGTTYFASNTIVWVGLTLNDPVSFTLTRNLSGTDYYILSEYDTDPLSGPPTNSSSKYAGIVLEYTYD